MVIETFTWLFIIALSVNVLNAMSYLMTGKWWLFDPTIFFKMKDGGRGE